jgi:hypothetical protein
VCDDQVVRSADSSSSVMNARMELLQVGMRGWEGQDVSQPGGLYGEHLPEDMH